MKLQGNYHTLETGHENTDLFLRVTWPGNDSARGWEIRFRYDVMGIEINHGAYHQYTIREYRNGRIVMRYDDFEYYRVLSLATLWHRMTRRVRPFNEIPF